MRISRSLAHRIERSLREIMGTTVLLAGVFGGRSLLGLEGPDKRALPADPGTDTAGGSRSH